MSTRTGADCHRKPLSGPCITFVCIASGPSLTADDCEKVRKWRQAGTAKDVRKVVVTNNTYQLCPWADYLYAMDRKWWEVMKPDFSGEKISIISGLNGVTKTRAKAGGNSGAGAILFAKHHGARKIILLGYDLKPNSDGLRHWHGAHVGILGNAQSLPKFAGQFHKILPDLSGSDVINCTRDTALNLFERKSLESVLDSPVINVTSMKGLGDNIYQRAVLREFKGTVYLDTPWPELYSDLPNIRPVRPSTKLRTQAKNVIRSETEWSQRPSGLPVKISYGSDGMLKGMEKSAGLAAVKFDLPDFGPSPVSGRYVVVRPVTVRSEWRADSRNPLPEYIATAARIARERGYQVVSVADLQDGAEWPVGELPQADITCHRGELSVSELMALVAGAAAVIGGIGWLAPAAMAYRTPAWVVCGGWGAYNSPDNLRAPVDAPIEYAVPDKFCRCSNRSHNCDKRITDYELKFTEFLKRHALVEC